MSDQSMVERVARALYDHDKREAEHMVALLDSSVGRKAHVHSLLDYEHVNLLYEAKAQAAIDAMPEITRWQGALKYVWDRCGPHVEFPPCRDAVERVRNALRGPGEVIPLRIIEEESSKP